MIDRAGRIGIDSIWIPPPARGPPKVTLAGPGWAGPGLFGRRGGFASIWYRFFFKLGLRGIWGPQH